MHKKIRCLFFGFCCMLVLAAGRVAPPPVAAYLHPLGEVSLNFYMSKYQQWQLANAGISVPLFYNAIKGFQHLLNQNKIKNSNIITLIDFSQPSTHKRWYTLDLSTGKILFNSLVAHGRNSGLVHANLFSNTPSSFQSSLGFYTTAATYMGKHGYSLQLQGCEAGINHLAQQRNIVVHGASYVSEQFIKTNGYLGRSQGCPAVPEPDASKIINVIKEGTCLFIYHPLPQYLIQSPCLKG
jgi:hypothetical protein